jgi:serine/threonine protein kinase
VSILELRKSTIDQIIIQSKIVFKTGFSEILEGRLRDQDEKVLLHKSNFKLDKNSTQEIFFLDFISKNQNLLNEGRILSYGIDLQGYAFIVYNYFQNIEFPIEKKLETAGKEIERLSLYIRALQAVDMFHENGIVLGDLSRQSFRIKDDNSIMFFGYFGSDVYESSFSKTKSSSEFLKYLSPEQKMGAKNSMVGDVYSLGILAYILMCGEDAIHESSTNSANFLRAHQAPSVVNRSLPLWIDKVIGSCLIMDPNKRIKSALDLLSYLEAGLRDGNVNLPEVKWSFDELIVQNTKQITPGKETIDSKNLASIKGQNAKESKSPQSKANNHSRAHKPKVNQSTLLVRLIWGSTILGLIVLTIGLMISFRVIQIGAVDLPSQFVAVEKEIEAYHLKNDLLTFLSNNEVDEVKLKALKSLLKKDIAIDKATSAYLSTISVKTPESSEYVKEALYYWLDKLGYEKVKSEITEKIDSGIYSQQPFNFFEISNLLLTSIDTSTVDQERVSSLRKLFVKDEIFSFRLVAQLVEESSSTLFIPIFKDFLSSRGFNEILPNSSKRSLFILLPETRSILGDNLENLLKESSNEDLKSIATALLSNTTHVDKDFFKQALKRYLEQFGMNKFSLIFVEFAQIEAENGSSVSIPLYKLALGTAKLKDLEVFIEWNSPQWEKVCYAILATNTNRDMLNRAMDILSRRTPTSQTAKSLLAWIRDNFWDERSKYGHALGIFALKDLATNEDIEKAFEEVLPAARSGLFQALTETGDTYFIREAALRIAPVATPKEIYSLLSSPIAEVRIAGVRALNGKNDLESLQKILKAFKNEKDPEVIKVYNEVHWVTKDRDIPGSIK